MERDGIKQQVFCGRLGCTLGSQISRSQCQHVEEKPAEKKSENGVESFIFSVELRKWEVDFLKGFL